VVGLDAVVITGSQRQSDSYWDNARGVGTAGATGALAPPRNVETTGATVSFIFAAAIFSHVFARCSFNFHSLSLAYVAYSYT